MHMNKGTFGKIVMMIFPLFRLDTGPNLHAIPQVLYDASFKKKHIEKPSEIFEDSGACFASNVGGQQSHHSPIQN